MRENGEQWFYRCNVCKRLCFSPDDAKRCCKSAKIQIPCAGLKETLEDKALERECCAIKAGNPENCNRKSKW